MLQMWLVALAAILLGACDCSGGAPKSASTGVKEAPAPEAPAAPSAGKGRLIVLGFDGVDPDWLDEWIKAGKLPALSALTKAHGGAAYRRLRSTNPPQSPVAWTSFATGVEPGDHGIFDFIGRSLNPGEGLPIIPKIATTSFEVPETGPPIAKNLRTGRPFWQKLGNDGVRVVALNVPYSFPPDPMRQGRMLSGLGVPDVRETNSTFTYVGTDVTPARAKKPPGGGALVPLTMQGGRGSFELEGPSIPGKPGERMKVPVEIRAGEPADGMTVAIGGRDVALKVGTYSDWIEIEFAHDATKVRGILRLLALEVESDVRLFITPIGFHPRAPYAPFSYPRAYSGDLADALEHLYKTVGWDHDTSALNAEVIDEADFLADVEATEADRRAMLSHQLERDDWDLLIWVSTATDRVAHMFYRLTDPEHPRYDAKLAERFGDAIEKTYVAMDAVVAQTQKALKPDDVLLVISDHGFHGYRRGLHVNQWLRREGLLALKGDAAGSDKDFFLEVDWARTKAYAMGTGQIYLNRAGRERDGIVTEKDAPQVTEQIRKGLLALRDTERDDAQVVRNVYDGSKVFQGKRASDAPDLQIAFAEYYRTSWETILGGVPEELFADNPKKWSGDHAASDVEETDGILVSSRAIAHETPAIVDLAPTITAFFGKDTKGYAGRALLEPAR
jgi:predicted AlkP superfamily phosphohydrolase/phosphomutase